MSLYPVVDNRCNIMGSIVAVVHMIMIGGVAVSSDTGILNRFGTPAIPFLFITNVVVVGH